MGDDLAVPAADKSNSRYESTILQEFGFSTEDLERCLPSDEFKYWGAIPKPSEYLKFSHFFEYNKSHTDDMEYHLYP